MLARLALAAAALAVPAAGADPPAGRPAGDRAALVGTWKIVDYQDDGRSRLDRLGAGPGKKGDPPRVAKLVFTADECYVLTGAGHRLTTAGHTRCDWKAFALDEAARPKAIDLVSPDVKDAAKPRTYYGVYELDGTRLRLCYNETPRATTPDSRPKKLVSDDDMNLLVCEKLSETPEKPGGK